MSALWARVVAFWDEREEATALAAVRIALAACWLYDLLHLASFGLVVPLFAAEEHGGWSAVLTTHPWPWWVSVFGATATSAQALHTTMTLAAAALLIGFRTRLAAAVLLIAWIQWAWILPPADRGIDQLSRHMLLILMFADSGRTWSVDALARTGRWFDETPAPSWPRKLILGQMVLMYFSAGVLKAGVTWWPMGGFAALYFALQDPSVAAYDFGWTRSAPWFQLTQVGTAVTILYQTTYPLVLLLLWWRRHPERAGRFGRWCVRHRLEWLWLAVGAWFHLSLGLVMNLGIFPWAMLALYPAWLDPSAIAALRDRWSGWRRAADV